MFQVKSIVNSSILKNDKVYDVYSAEWAGSEMLNTCINLYTSIVIVLLMCVLFYWLFCDSKADMVFLMAIVIFWPFYAFKFCVVKFALVGIVKVLNRFIDDMIHL